MELDDQDMNGEEQQERGDEQAHDRRMRRRRLPIVDADVDAEEDDNGKGNLFRYTSKYSFERDLVKDSRKDARRKKAIYNNTDVSDD